MINILHEEIFTALHEDGQEIDVSLPGLLSLLGKEKIGAIKRLRAYQEHAMHMFLVQLAAVALDKQDRANFDLSHINAEMWRDLLLGLADTSAWELVAEDTEKIAFMQPVLSKAEFMAAAERGIARSPDALSDLYHKSKSHVTKVGGGVLYEPCDWVFALLDRQTLSGHGGKGKYRISRMSGAYGCRFMTAVYPAGASWGERWIRDTTRLLKMIPDIYEEYPLYDRQGPQEALLWTLPWDGKNQTSLQQLHPYFIELCRRVRLFSVNGEIASVESTSAGTRVDTSMIEGGDIGDPWAPTELYEKGGSSYYRVLTPKYLGAARLKDIILGKGGVRPSPLQRLLPEDRTQDMVLVAKVLLGGQGKVEGFHSLNIPIPSRIAVALFGGQGSRQQELEQFAQDMIDARAKHEDILKSAISKFIKESFGSAKTNLRSYMNNRCLRQLAEVADQEFFPYLWQALDAGGVEKWVQRLHEESIAALTSVIHGSQARTPRFTKASVIAEDAYSRMWNKHFKRERGDD